MFDNLFLAFFFCREKAKKWLWVVFCPSPAKTNKVNKLAEYKSSQRSWGQLALLLH